MIRNAKNQDQCNSNDSKPLKNSEDRQGKILLNIHEDILTSKPYIIYEHKVEINEYMNNKTKYDNESLVHLKIMHQYITEAMNALLTKNRFVNKKFDIAMMKSHEKIDNGKYYSFYFRFIVNGTFRFKNTYDAMQLVTLIKSISKHPEVTKYINTTCYGKTPNDIQQINTVLLTS